MVRLAASASTPGAGTGPAPVTLGGARPRAHWLVNARATASISAGPPTEEKDASVPSPKAVAAVATAATGRVMRLPTMAEAAMAAMRKARPPPAMSHRERRSGASTAERVRRAPHPSP